MLFSKDPCLPVQFVAVGLSPTLPMEPSVGPGHATPCPAAGTTRSCALSRPRPLLPSPSPSVNRKVCAGSVRGPWRNLFCVGQERGHSVSDAAIHLLPPVHKQRGRGVSAQDWKQRVSVARVKKSQQCAWGFSAAVLLTAVLLKNQR